VNFECDTLENISCEIHINNTKWLIRLKTAMYRLSLSIQATKSILSLPLPSQVKESHFVIVDVSGSGYVSTRTNHDCFIWLCIDNEKV
jgi:hypothetical protein